MLAPLVAGLTLALVAIAPGGSDAAGRRSGSAARNARSAEPRGHAAESRKGTAATRSSVAGGELARARAQLAEVKRDPAKRRYRDRWERAIASLEKAARGRHTGPALLEAARARYALYRFSQVESDRVAALALARKAEKAGAREASLLRNAIRAEMGEPRAPASAQRRKGSPGVATTPPPSPPAARSMATGSPRPEPRPGRVAKAAPAQPPGGSRPPGAGLQASRPEVPPQRAAEAGGGAPAVAGGRADNAARPDADEESSMDAILERALASAEPEPERAPEGAVALVSELKTWSNHDYTRIALYLSGSVSFERVDLPGGDDRTRRVALDLRPAHLERALGREVGDAQVRSIRATQTDDATVRVVLDLAGDQELTIFPLDEPARLIVDVGVAPRPRPEVAAPTPRGDAPGPAPLRPGSAATAPPARDELATTRPIRRVIVDAGHGGHDTGAIGPTNVREKDVTLAIARRLEKRLRARGYEVALTRSDDRYVALEERTAIANARHGDLFVSIHANAHPRRDRHGVETYVLDVTSDRYSRRLAARENGALGEGAADIPVLRRILSDLEAKASVQASRRVAAEVQRELCAGIRSRVGEVRDLGVKSALFHVLLGARMPAVLVETAFISNRVEERRLASASFQEEIATAIVRAVERVGSGEARVASTR